MSTEMTLHLGFKYDFTHPASIDDAINSLKAIEKILKRSPKLINKLIPRFNLKDIEISVESVTAGSLREDLLIKFIFGSETEMDAFVQYWREKMGLTTVQGKSIILGLVFLFIVAGGITMVAKILKPHSENAQIQLYNSTIINIGASEFEKSPEQLKEIIERSFSKTEQVKNAYDTLTLLKPLRVEGELLINNDVGSKIGRNVINELPNVDEIEEISYDELERVRIEIRAIDKDSKKRGWAVRIPQVTGEKRIKMELEEGIDVNQLATHDFIVGDVMLVNKTVNGEKIAEKVILISIHSKSTTVADKSLIVQPIQFNP